MPVPLRTTFHKAEAKYNVTTEFPSLGLHSAAATGNVGLVEYALEHGQPVNSVLDGVLPLHAACAGGNLQVVKVLIEHGADVNAPRLPRKYSNDKNRDNSAPIVGTSGSTPLHFAAANGNKDVVSLLLLHGAHADRADKHGVTPEMLAQQNGWIECSRVLRDWILNKDRDLRERAAGFDSRAGPSNAQDISDPNFSPSNRRRLHVKQSIDTALNMLKSTDARPSRSAHTPTPPASPMKPFGEYTFYPVDPAAPIDLNSRRPSLPQIPQPPPHDPSRNRKPSASVSTADTKKIRRPRSAGTGAERTDRKPSPEVMYPVYGRGGSGRRLGNKYSLMNIFRKAQPEDASESSLQTSELSSSQDSPAVPGSTVTLPLPSTSSYFANASSPFLPEDSGHPATAPCRTGFFHRGSDASTRGGRVTPLLQTSALASIPTKPSGTLQNQTPPRVNQPSALELHLALQQQQQQRTRPGTPGSGAMADDSDNVKAASPLARLNPLLHNRNRSASSSSAPFEIGIFADDEASPGAGLDSGESKPVPSPSTRPGILRAHNRTNSGQGTPPNPRTLRFDSSSSTPASERKSRDSPRVAIPPPLKSQSSSSSISKLHIQTNRDNVDTSSMSESDHTATAIPGSSPADNDVEDESYGQPIISEEAPNVPSVLLQRQRGLSFASSSESSLSPILTNDNPNAPELNSDFPFSINRPPSLPLESDDLVDELPSSPGRLGVPALVDSRGRGDSMSSNSTSDSRSNMHMSSSGTSMTVSTPGMSGMLLLPLESDSSMDGRLSTRQPDISSGDDEGLLQPPSALTSSPHGKKRAHTPLDIDIANISSHAQAEALVQRARQDVLDLAGAQDLSPTASSGRTPLSARLAAYGESLALERKLREQKLAEESYWKDKVHDPMPNTASEAPLPSATDSPVVVTPRQRTKSREGMERQLSLEHRSPSRPRKIRNDPRRPSTAEGALSSRQQDSFFNSRTVSHQSSRSTSDSHPPTAFVRDDINAQLLHYSNTHDDARQEPSLTPQTAVPRSRTPNNPPEESLSRISSTDGADTETDSGLNLHRVTTSPNLSSTRKSAKKLARMGIPVAEQAAAASRSTPPTPPTSKRFGAIKSLMQTFKGKA